tara:strand:- start:954 stop:1772 length:819 start_codon:yes stop_codon:yes gene_type:complete
MFRKGGNVGDGIMTGIVDREDHALSDPDGVGGQTFRDNVQNRIDLIESVSGGTGLDDPLTQFLLQYGPALANKTPTGGIIGTAVGAAEKPVASLLKNVQSQKKLKTGVALEVLDSMEDEDIAPFIEKAKQIAKETGRDYQTVLNQLVETELYRKGKSPQQKKEEGFEVDMAGLINITDGAGNALITPYGAREVVNAINNVKSGKVEGISYDDIDLDTPFLKKDTQILKELEGGILEIDEDDAAEYQNGGVIYDYRRNKYFKRQGNQLVPIGA